MKKSPLSYQYHLIVYLMLLVFASFYGCSGDINTFTRKKAKKAIDEYVAANQESLVHKNGAIIIRHEYYAIQQPIPPENNDDFNDDYCVKHFQRATYKSISEVKFKRLLDNNFIKIKSTDSRQHAGYIKIQCLVTLGENGINYSENDRGLFYFYPYEKLIVDITGIRDRYDPFLGENQKVVDLTYKYKYNKLGKSFFGKEESDQRKSHATFSLYDDGYRLRDFL